MDLEKIRLIRGLTEDKYPYRQIWNFKAGVVHAFVFFRHKNLFSTFVANIYLFFFYL